MPGSARPEFGARFVTPLLLGSMLNPVNSTMLATALVPIGQTYHVGAAATAWLVTALYLASAVAQPVLGGLVDRFGPRRIFLAGMALVGAAGLAGTLLDSLGALIAIRALIGIGTSAGYPAAMALVRAQSDRLGRPTPGSVLGAITVAAMVSGVIGPPLGGLLVSWAGWRSIFLVNVPFAVLGIVLTLCWLPPDAPAATRAPRPGGALRAVLRDGSLLRTYLRCGLAFLVIYGVFYGFTQWLQEPAGFSSAAAGLLVLPMSAVAAVSSLVGARRSVRGALLLGTGAMLAAAIALLFLHAGTPVLLLVAVAALFGLPNGLNPVGNQAAMYAQAPAGHTGTAAGLFRTAQYLGAICSASLIGTVYGQRATDAGLHTLAGLFVVASVLLLVFTIADRVLSGTNKTSENTVHNPIHGKAVHNRKEGQVAATELDERTALVLIDLQKGIASAPVQPVPSAEVVGNAARLAAAFRAKGLPVVLVRVTFSADGGDALVSRAERQFVPRDLPPDFADLVAELDQQPSDIVITKRQWGAFHGTELDLQLRRRKVTGIVLAGVATSIGVESTARAAHEHGYNLTVVSDAVSDMDPGAHEHSLTRIFPRIAEIDRTDEILALLEK